MNSNFYIPQSSYLQNIIHSIWQVERFNSFHKEHIIPKGIVELIFNFSDGAPILAQLEGKQYQVSNCFINGFNTVPVQLQVPKQQVFFGVVFQPLVVKRIFGTPAYEFSDRLVDLPLLDSTYHSLWHQLVEQKTFNSRVATFCSWIERKMLECQPQEKLINNFLSAIHGHDVSVRELANSVCYSPRHLSRKIFEATGVSTEEILLYKKYLHALHLIHHSDLSLTEIAYQSHFSDQSHFIKSFKFYTKMTPKEYKRNKSYLKGHIYEDVR